ncbi:KxYKxGKxW signal peptide domain-containing protein [Companilactobacillus musae]|uniref:KxYKxGKxW signal peptide domain-containing protein n=1 Tax=Companilactobacillus musae TaxID=1903258 RepID=UPI0013C2C789|nr:KxYKxGKxW signal peptide domain-containing protein [Companilactobacillus musae]
MRFNQLKANPNAIVRKKLYKKGKVWVVASMLGFAGIMMLSTMPVKATTVNNTQQEAIQQDPDSESTKNNGSQTNDNSNLTAVTKSLMVSSNLGDVEVSVNGQEGTTVNVPVPTKTGYTVTSSPTVAVEINEDGSVSTSDVITYTADNTNTNNVQAADVNDGVQTQAADTTQNDNDTADYMDEDSYVYQGDNVKQNADGTYSASVTYQGQTYDVTGNIGDTVRKTDSSGNSVVINIEANKQEKFIGPADGNKIILDSPSGYGYIVNDKYGLKLNVGLAGNSDWTVDAQMTDYNGNIYYHTIDIDGWIEANTGVTFQGGNLNPNTAIITPVFIVNDPTLNNGEYKSVTGNLDKNSSIYTGTVVVHSDYYDKDFTYSYSGKAGEIVKATLSSNNESMVTPDVSVKIESYSKAVPLIGGNTLFLEKKDNYIYKVYKLNNKNIDITLSNRGLPAVDEGQTGGTIWQTDSYRYINNVLYYRVSTSEWLKQVNGVEYDGGVDISNNTTEADYKITPYVEPLIVADVTIDSNLGEKSVKEISGLAGDKVTVKVPDVPGYTKDKDSVTAVINADGTITTDETVTYKKVSSGNGGSGEQLDIVKKNQNVSTFVDKGDVTLYKLSGTNFVPVTNRALAENTDWYSDQYVKLGDMTYFRVATNEWVRISSVYRYKDFNTIANTKDQIARLLNDEGALVTNRALAPRTSWLVDRIGYLGSDDNPTSFYRVATNEFLNISDTIQ